MQKVTMEDLGKIETISEVSYSPDGKAAAFVVNRALIRENKYASFIWVLENGIPRKLTSGGAESSYLWLDGENLLFPGDRAKSHKPAPGSACTVYNRIHIHGGEAEEFFTIPMKVKNIRKVNDHEFLVTGLYQHGAIDLSGLEGREREEAAERLEEEKDYEVFDELPFWANGKGVINKQRTRLYLYDSESGECRLLSPEFMNVSSFDYHKETDQVLYYGHNYQWMDDQKDDMFVCGLHSGETVEVALGHRYGVSGAAFLGNQVILRAAPGKNMVQVRIRYFSLQIQRAGQFPNWQIWIRACIRALDRTAAMEGDVLKRRQGTAGTIPRPRGTTPILSGWTKMERKPLFLRRLTEVLTVLIPLEGTSCMSR